jgi:hypothetical protein
MPVPEKSRLMVLSLLLALPFAGSAAAAQVAGHVLVLDAPQNRGKGAIIIVYVDAETGDMARLAAVEGGEELWFAADREGQRIVCGDRSEDQKTSLLRVVDIGPTIKIRDLPQLGVGNQVIQTWFQKERAGSSTFIMVTFEGGKEAKFVFERLDLGTLRVNRIKEQDLDPMQSLNASLGGRPRGGPYLFFDPSKGPWLKSDCLGKSIPLSIVPPASLYEGRPPGEWLFVGDRNGSFALREQYDTRKKKSCRILYYRHKAKAWANLDFEGQETTAYILGNYLICQEAAADPKTDPDARAGFAPHPTGRFKVVSFETGQVIELNLGKDSVILAVDDTTVLARDGDRLLLMNYDKKGIGAPKVLAKRESILYARYAFPVAQKPDVNLQKADITNRPQTGKQGTEAGGDDKKKDKEAP